MSRTRRLDLAEDALAEAFTQAAARWPSTGIPTTPGGWLSVRSDLARRSGDNDLAVASYGAALELCGNDVERAHIRARLSQI